MSFCSSTNLTPSSPKKGIILRVLEPTSEQGKNVGRTWERGLPAGGKLQRRTARAGERRGQRTWAQKLKRKSRGRLERGFDPSDMETAMTKSEALRKHTELREGVAPEDKVWF